MSSLRLLILSCSLMFLFFSATTEARSIKYKRSTDGNQICSASMPCGWSVYQPSSRAIEYFVSSPCSCPTGDVCVRTSDDISISAYVHRCRQDSSDFVFSADEEEER